MFQCVPTLFKLTISTLAFLVLCNRLVAVVVALAMIKFNKESLVNAAPIKNFFMVSVSNVFATFCQYEGTCDHRFFCDLPLTRAIGSAQVRHLPDSDAR